MQWCRPDSFYSGEVPVRSLGNMLMNHWRNSLQGGQLSTAKTGPYYYIQ